MLLFTFFSSCSDKRSPSVDQAYLESKTYRSFEDQIRQEREQSIQQHKEFIAFVRQKLEENEDGGMSLPATINEKQIQALADSNTIGRSLVKRLLGFEQVYHPIGTVKHNVLEYHFFMTCKVANYKDCLIWFASTKAGNLVQLQMLTTYKKTFTYSIVPQINVTASKISIEMNSSVKYPMRIVDRYTLQYHISAS
ncbi:MAG: hypothetical protein JXR26_07050, partial [Balneolaceae bacterium]|nr:hypothetical protein [Balneolaceae bacterium]